MISIHALREEGDDVQSYDRSTELISIHALREEGDFWMLSYCCCKTISIHALREEGDAIMLPFWKYLETFLSTPSARRATCAAAWPRLRSTHFYPRPPRGGRQWSYVNGILKV